MKTKLHCLTTLYLLATLPLFADNEDYSNQDVSGMDFRGKSMVNSNWTNANASNVNFMYTKLQGADFTNANLSGANFLYQSNLTYDRLLGANFSNAVINNCNFRYSGFNFDHLKLTKSYNNKDLTGIDFGRCDFSNGDFSGQNLTGSRFVESTLTNVDFSNACIRDVNFSLAKGFTKWQLYSSKSYIEKNLNKIVLSSTHSSSSSGFVGCEFGGFNLTSTKFHSLNLSSSNFAKSDISNSELKSCNLDDANFLGANLKGADLYGSSFNNAIFTNATITGADIRHTYMTKEQLYSTKSYKEKNLKGISIDFRCDDWDFSGQDLSFSSFKYASLKNANFTDSIITNVDFYGTKGECLTKEQLYSTKSYKDKDLSGCSFGGTGTLYDADLSNQNLTSSYILLSSYIDRNRNVDSKYDTNITDAVIKNATIYSVSLDSLHYYVDWFVWGKICSTKSYKDKDLSGLTLDGFNIQFRGVDLSMQNLQNVTLCGNTTITGNLNYADLRGAKGDFVGWEMKNTIWTDGEIKNLTMKSSNDSLLVRKYSPKKEGVAMINAKIVDDATISGGAVLTLEEGAILEVAAGKTLTVSDGEMIFNIDVASNDTKLLLNSGSKLVFDSDSKITINLDGEISADDSYAFSVIQPASDSYILGMDSIQKENITLNVNGETYDADKWGIDYDPTTGEFNINVNIPEPATYAAIFGGLALLLAFAKRRR